MSDSKRDDDRVRRVGRQQRKRRLDRPDPLFAPPDPTDETQETIPVDDPDAASEQDEQADLPDLETLSLPDTDHEALESLSSLSPDMVKMPRVTPQEDRYPPIDPARMAASRPARPSSEQAKAAVSRPVKASPRARFYNRLSVVALLASGLMLLYYVAVWIEPFWLMNPFPPDPAFVYVTATAPAQTRVIVITSTPAAGADAVDGGVSPPVSTAPPSNPVVAAAVESDFAFVMSDAGIIYAPNGNDRGCEWASIAGTASRQDGTPLNSYRVRIQGEGLDETVFTGAARTFGPGGFELPLGSIPQEGTYTIQLLTPQGSPVSDEYTVIMDPACERNVAIINFVQIRDL